MQLPVGVITALIGVPVFLVPAGAQRSARMTAARAAPVVPRPRAVASRAARSCAGLDLDVRAGERWAIVGPNGAGKTTLVATLAGLRAPAAGTIAYDGIAARPRSRRASAR